MRANDKKSYLSYLNKLVDQYNNTIIILLVKNLLMVIILLLLKKLRQNLNSKLVIEYKTKIDNQVQKYFLQRLR